MRFHTEAREKKVRSRTKAQRHEVAQRKNIFLGVNSGKNFSHGAHRGTEKKVRSRTKAQGHEVAQRKNIFLG